MSSGGFAPLSWRKSAHFGEVCVLDVFFQSKCNKIMYLPFHRVLFSGDRDSSSVVEGFVLCQLKPNEIIYLFFSRGKFSTEFRGFF